MADETWGDSTARNFERRYIRTIRHENVNVQVHVALVEIYAQLFREMTLRYIEFPRDAVGYRPADGERAATGRSVVLPRTGLEPVTAFAGSLGLIVDEDRVDYGSTLDMADIITRSLVDARVTALDSIETSMVEITRPGTRLIAEGDAGPDVAFLHYFLMTDEDTTAFTPALTARVREFQQARGLEPTGIADQAFWLSMFPERPVQVGPGDGGMRVRMVQALILALDYGSTQITSSYGTRTTRDVRWVQEANSLRQTGFVRGPEWGALVHRPVDGFPLG